MLTPKEPQERLAQAALRARSLHASFTHWRFGRDFASDLQRWFLAYFRLEESVHAAAAVAYHAALLARWASEVSSDLDQAVGARRPLTDLLDGELVEVRAAASLLAEGDYLFHDTVWWARAFQDRMFATARGDLQADGLLRLLPRSVSSRLHKAVAPVRDLLGDARLLANYSLHAESVNRLTPVIRRNSGAWQIPIPDRQEAAVVAYTNFNYEQGRTAVEYCDGLARTIADLVEMVLSSVEEAEGSRA